MVKNTYGTGCFPVMNLGEEPVTSKANLLTTVAWKLDGRITYALEGSIFIAGAILQWLRDEMGLIRSAAESEKIAAGLENNGGVYLVPALTGLGAPHWDQFARGTIVGLTRGTGKKHIVRAALEGIAFQVTDVVRAMQEDSGEQISELRVDGGASVNNFLMQFQSDMLNTKVTRPAVMETTALGAAYLAGLVSGFWKGQEELKEQWVADRSYVPGMKEDFRQELLRNWQKALKRSGSWLEKDA
jgi:glycerol kinase